MGLDGYFPKVLYLCNGTKSCKNSPYCRVNHPEINEDEGCIRTLQLRAAKYGECKHPEKHPERFKRERINGDVDYYIEKEEA